MFESLLHQSMSYYDQPDHNITLLTTRLSNDARMIHKIFGEGFAKQIQALSTLFIALGIGFSASWEISLVVLATFPLTIFFSMIQMQTASGQQ